MRERRGVDGTRRRDRGAPFSRDAGLLGLLDGEVPSKTGQTRPHNTHPSHDNRPSRLSPAAPLLSSFLGDAANAAPQSHPQTLGCGHGRGADGVELSFALLYGTSLLPAEHGEGEGDARLPHRGRRPPRRLLHPRDLRPQRAASGRALPRVRRRRRGDWRQVHLPVVREEHLRPADDRLVRRRREE